MTCGFIEGQGVGKQRRELDKELGSCIDATEGWVGVFEGPSADLPKHSWIRIWQLWGLRRLRELLVEASSVGYAEGFWASLAYVPALLFIGIWPRLSYT